MCPYNNEKIMQIHDNRLIAECTSYDFKEMLERKKVKSWLKSVSAFANTDGGSLFYGVNDEGEIVGLKNVQADANFISEMIKAHLDSAPENPMLTREKMADELGISLDGVKKQIKNLRVRGILVHEGSDKASYWCIIVKP